MVPFEAGVIQNDLLCGGPYSIDVVVPPEHGTLIADLGGSFEYTPDPAAPQTDSFTYSLKQNDVELDQADALIWVVSDDCTAVAFADSYDANFETVLTVPGPGFVANDTLDCPIKEPFSFEIQSGPTHGTIIVDPDDGGFEYEPDAGFSGDDEFVYNVRGATNSLLMAQAVVSIDVGEKPCVAIDDSYTTTVDESLTVPSPGVLGNDTLCDAYNYGVFVAQGPGHGEVALSSTTGEFHYTPDPGYAGEDQFTYQMWGDVEPLEILATATVFIDVGGDDDLTPTTTTDTDTTTTTDAATTTTTTTTDGGTTTTTATATTTTDGGTTTTVASGTTSVAPATGSDTSVPGQAPWAPLTLPPGGFRVATFNASLSRAAAGELLADLSTPDDAQAANVAEIIQRVRPDIVVLNEFDYVAGGAAVGAFRTNYLAIGHNGAEPIDYPYFFIAPTNAGVPGLDLDNDGSVGGPGDAFGFGDFEGQSGMVVLSRFPIVDDGVRTFQNLLWTSMPGARLPDDPDTPAPADFYSHEELNVMRLSSTSHWDVPVYVDGRVVHVLAAHPTAPGFDGSEHGNGQRNADEIRFWADYVSGDATWIIDDAGASGGLTIDSEFVIVGTLNSDPLDGDTAGAIDQLLTINRIRDLAPASEGAVEAAESQGQANQNHTGDPASDTADFPDDTVGNLRVDYVLPSNGLDVLASDVFWPSDADELSRLVTIDPLASSDHRLVWVDLI